MITASNITAAQLSQVWHIGVERVDPDVMHLSTVALNFYGDFTWDEERRGRPFRPVTEARAA